MNNVQHETLAKQILPILQIGQHSWIFFYRFCISYSTWPTWLQGIQIFFTKSCFLTYSQKFCDIQYNHISIAYLVTSVLSSLVPDVLAFEETLTEHSESTLMSHLWCLMPHLVEDTIRPLHSKKMKRTHEMDWVIRWSYEVTYVHTYVV